MTSSAQRGDSDRRGDRRSGQRLAQGCVSAVASGVVACGGRAGLRARLALFALLLVAVGGCGAAIPEVTVRADALRLPADQGAVEVQVAGAGERVERVWLALHMDAAARQPLTPSGGGYALDLSDPATAAALTPGGGQGVAFVFVAFASGVKVASAPIPYTLDGVPVVAVAPPDDALRPDDAPLQALHLDGHAPTLRLPQRTTSPLPGSRGQVLVSVGDITGDRVATLTVRQPKVGLLVNDGPLGAGQAVRFYVGSSAYTLRVEALSDTSLGGDGVTLTLHEGDVGAAQPVGAQPPITLSEATRRAALVAEVERSGAVFVRNGEQYDAVKAARFIEAKLQGVSPEVPLEACIRDHLSASSQTGEPYAVWLPDGRAMAAGEWLLALAATLR